MRIVPFGWAVATIAIAGAAVAQTPSVINACVKNDDGNMRFVANGACKANETLLTWSQAGPQGPAGQQGPAGERGPAGPEAPRADGACYSAVGDRYQDCGNGTVTDSVTGLIWLKQANCVPPGTWEAAFEAAALMQDGQCGLTDGSLPGDWRLPTREEWEATIADAVRRLCKLTSGSGGDRSPSLIDATGRACYQWGIQLFVGLQPGDLVRWWSSSMPDDDSSSAWSAGLTYGNVHPFSHRDFTHLAWPVRRGR